MFEIGNSLREARLRQGHELQHVELATKIRAKYLRALEEEQFEVLPAETYVKGFLRTYADYLGLDGQLYVDEYNSRFVVDSEEVSRPRRSPTRTRQQRRLESRALVLALLGIVAATALVIVAWRYGGGQKSVVLTQSATPAAAVRQDRTAHLVLRATGGGSFVEVRRSSAHGKQIFSGTIERGEAPQEFTGRRLWLRVRKPKALRLTLNGHRIHLPHRGTYEVTKAGVQALPR